MNIDIRPILKETGSKLDIDITESLSFEEEEIKLIKPVSVKGQVINTGKSVLLIADVKTEIELECGRCLDKFSQPLEFKIEEQFYRDKGQYRELTGEIELSEEDFIFMIEEDSIDLYEILRQNIIANIPIISVCKPDCPGIQSQRGKEEEIDPRLEKLKQIKEAKQNK